MKADTPEHLEVATGERCLPVFPPGYDSSTPVTLPKYSV